mgnify:FL=1
MLHKMVLVLFLAMFGAGCVSAPEKSKVLLFPQNEAAKNLLFMGIKGGGVYRGADIKNINSGEDGIAFIRNLWKSPPADKAVYLEQISSRMIVGEDGKEKEVQFTTIFVFSSSTKEKLRGWHIMGELRSGAVVTGSLRYVTRGSPDFFSMVFVPKPDVLVYAWIDKAAADEAITPEEFAKMILPYRTFTFSIFKQVHKQPSEQKPVEQIKKQPEEQKQST